MDIDSPLDPVFVPCHDIRLGVLAFPHYEGEGGVLRFNVIVVVEDELSDALAVGRCLTEHEPQFFNTL